LKIKIVGAAGGEVTGSAYFVQTERAKVLVHAGKFQGGKRAEAQNRLPAGVNLSKLNAVLLTHAHLDHTGRVPLLVKHGFAGRVLATAATIDLAELILQDSARLQAQDAQRVNRFQRVAGRGSVESFLRGSHCTCLSGFTLCCTYRLRKRTMCSTLGVVRINARNLLTFDVMPEIEGGGVCHGGRHWHRALWVGAAY
jgi:metallo-beta-lactamase superfamily protein